MQSDCSESNLNNFIKNLGFDNFSTELVSIAFTHSSYTKENDLDQAQCYERLEFLGDAVLKMATTNYLYNAYPDKTEGELTKIRSIIVSDEIMHKVAKNINIEPHIKVCKAEKKNNVQSLPSIQACVMEALFGALYLSSDKEKLDKFIINNLIPYIKDIVENKTIYNAKALLQEYTQGKSKTIPTYKLIEQTGAAHTRIFTMAVYYENECLGQASAKTKKQAEQEAAYIACKTLGLIDKNKEVLS